MAYRLALSRAFSKTKNHYGDKIQLSPQHGVPKLQSQLARIDCATPISESYTPYLTHFTVTSPSPYTSPRPCRRALILQSAGRNRATCASGLRQH